MTLPTPSRAGSFETTQMLYSSTRSSSLGEAKNSKEPFVGKRCDSFNKRFDWSKELFPETLFQQVMSGHSWNDSGLRYMTSRSRCTMSRADRKKRWKS